MDKTKSSIHILSLLSLILCAHTLHAQIEPMKSVVPVAQRVIDDTSFTLTEVTQSPLTFVLIVDCTPYVQSEGEITATATIEAPADSTYNIGFAASASARVWINGKRVFKSDTSGNPFAREIAEGNYEFPYYAAVTLNKGVNRVEVKTNGKISLGVLDAQGFADERIKYDGGTFTDFLKRQYEPVRRTELRLSVKDSATFRLYPYAEWNAANATTMYGILTLGRAMAERRYTDFAAGFCAFSTDNAPTFEQQYNRNNSLRTQNYTLFRMTTLADAAACALPLLELRLSALGNNISSGQITDQIANYVIKEHPRLDDGTFVRSQPRWSVWADDLFMSVPFLIRYGKQLFDAKYFDEAARQIINYDKYLYNTETRLYHHGWNNTEKKHMGEHWGRANGLMLWAMTEATTMIPTSHKDYDKVAAIYRRAVENIARYQSPDGLWHQILNDPLSYGETSATAMFTLAIARGVASGVLNESYATNALKGWLALEKQIDAKGIVNGISPEIPIGNHKAQYLDPKPILNDPNGIGALLMAAVEVDKMLVFIPEKSRRALFDTLLVSKK